MNPYIKNLEKIEFVVTMACTGKCRHCSEGNHDGFTEHIDKTVAAEAVRKICSSYEISTVMTFGGEPLLYPDTVCAIHKTAASLGVAKRQASQTGFSQRTEARSELLRCVWPTVASMLCCCPWTRFIRKPFLSIQ